MNTKGWFASLVCKPEIVTREGTYKTRCGDIVTITKVSHKQDFGCNGFYNKCLIGESWHKSGRIFFGQECDNDIVAYIGSKE